MRLRAIVAPASVLLACAGAPAKPPSTPQAEAERFFATFSELYRAAYTASTEAAWAAASDVTPEHTGESVGAGRAFAAVVGNRSVIETVRRLLARRAELDPVTARALQVLLLDAAESPGTIPEVVRARVEEEAVAKAIQDGFAYCLRRAPGGRCDRPVTPNDIDRVLRTSADPAERLEAWRASKEVGTALAEHLAKLRDLRNRVAREMGYTSYFALSAAEYGMTADELMRLLDGFVAQVEPLHRALACTARGELARRFRAAEPPGPIPAHWLGNRWAQAWPGIVPAIDMDALVAAKTPQWIQATAEGFYAGIGFPPLPESYHARSDLWALPAGAARKKNTHASAWHVDLERDVRSLQSIEADWRWFETAHHELGHVFYFLAYARPEVPLLLRRGANRAFHEGIGELIAHAAAQEPYLRDVGLLAPGTRIDRDRWLLNAALDDAIVFIPWAAGTVSHFEYDLYEKDLPASQFDARWWAYAERFQRVAPPVPRASGCDACTKTHLIDTPAYYYNYAIARALAYQLHRHICRRIIGADPHACSYAGRKDVGAFLWRILDKGATEDWRTLLRDAIGEDLSLDAMVEYYAPLARTLPAGATCGM